MKTFLAAVLGWGAAAWCAGAATTINRDNFAAWGANIGWLSWRGDVVNGAVIGEYVCSGYLWGANVGWILLGDGTPVNGVIYQNNAANDCGVNHDGLGNLRGLAWGANIGWVNFHPQGNPRVDLQTGILSGHAWGANVGWISLSNAAAYVQTDTIRPGIDTDRDSIADAWEWDNFGHLLGANARSDADGDGFLDREEYGADSDPFDPASSLRITGFNVGSGESTVTITWSSRPSRWYYIARTANLNPPIVWSDVLGVVAPSAGATTTRTFPVPTSTQWFFQVSAVKPLSP